MRFLRSLLSRCLLSVKKFIANIPEADIQTDFYCHSIIPGFTRLGQAVYSLETCASLCNGLKLLLQKFIPINLDSNKDSSATFISISIGIYEKQYLLKSNNCLSALSNDIHVSIACSVTVITDYLKLIFYRLLI